MLVLALVLLVAAALAAKEDLLVLTNENFYEEIEKRGKVFVKFFAPWCGHCKRLAPVWEELAGTIENITVAEMDCTVEAHESICSTYQVNGFPTIVLIESNGAFMKYEDAREADVMREWAIEMSGPASHKLGENEDIKDKDISFIFVGAEEEDLEKWNEVMSPFKGRFGIFHVEGKTYKGQEVSGKSVIIKKTQEDLKVVPYDPESMSEVVRQNSRLLVTQLGPKNFSNMAADPEHVMWVTFVNNVHDEEFEAEYAKLKEASLKCGETVNFTYINAVDFEGFTKNFGDMKEVPFSLILKPNDYLFYKFPADADICQFVADVAEGKVEAEDVRKRNSDNGSGESAQ